MAWYDGLAQDWNFKHNLIIDILGIYVRIDDKSELVQVMAYHRIGSKPLAESMMIQCIDEYGDIDLGQHWLRYCLDAWRHQPITWMTAHYSDVIMGTIAYQITSLTVVYSTVYSDADQRKQQSSASLAFVWGIHRDRWIPRTSGQ